MAEKLWKVHGTLALTNPSTHTYQYAEPREVLEEVTMPGTTDSDADVRVFRMKESGTPNALQSYIVSRAELEANATAIS